MDVLASASIAACVVVAAFVVLVGRLLSSARIRDFDVEALQRFSTESYRPMERLLSLDDIEFLRSQTGYERRIEKNLMRARRRVFRSYLRAMGKDFNRLHLVLRLMVLHAKQDRSDLAVVLVRQKALFFVALAFAHVRLSLHALGIGTVDVGGMVRTLDALRLELKSLSLAPQMVA